MKIKEENQTLATTTLQNYFRLYEKLAGMTGTAETEAGEFASTYNLSVVPIPTHRPMVRLDEPDLIYKSEKSKFAAVVEDIAERHEKGQPVLVGTVSVEKSELVSHLLAERRIPHAVLNAKFHTSEAEIVAQAGRSGGVTVATNMAGRGVDILLGGNPEGLARREVAQAGINPDLLDLDTDDPAIVEALESQPEAKDALAKAKVIFGEARPRLEESCRSDGDAVRALGGLYVLATERHESRRIDNQLRGRAGRQGDPGESRFNLSLEDDLMRLFATGAMNWVMGRALPDDVPIEAKMVTKAIERAQNTVEARNAEIRKNVLKYDEVMNEQRKVIYAKREQILSGGDLRDQLVMDLEEAMSDIVAEHCEGEFAEAWDFDSLLIAVQGYYPTEFAVEDLKAARSKSILVESFVAEAVDKYEAREAELGAETVREVERNVLLGIVDQRWREHLSEMDYLQEGINLRAMGQKDPLVEWQREGFDMFSSMVNAIDDDFVRYAMHADVSTLDAHSPEIRDLQLSSADEGSIGGFGMDVGAMFAATAAVPEDGDDDDGESFVQRVPEAEPEPQKPIVKSEQDRIGRNDPCFCGSGKKFKNCHGK